MPTGVKGKVYRTMVRPVLIYGSEAWTLRRREEERLERTETRMLRWILGLTLRDRKRNDDIRRILGVACITDKVRETMLRWYYGMYNGEKRMIVSNGSWRQMYRIYSRISGPLKIESVCGPKSLTHISRRWFLRTCTGCKLCSTEAYYCVHLPLSKALS